MNRFFSFLVLSLFLLPFVSAAVVEYSPTNMINNTSPVPFVTTSNKLNDVWKAFDGNEGTASSQAVTTVTFRIDLGQARTIDNFYWLQRNMNQQQKYYIQYSNNSVNWTVAYDHTSSYCPAYTYPGDTYTGCRENITFNPVNARYWELAHTASSTNNYGSVNTIRLFGNVTLITVPAWVYPTPANDSVWITQVTLNITSNISNPRYTVWVGNSSSSVDALVMENSPIGSYKTNFGASGAYYYKARVSSASGDYSDNTTVRMFNFLYIPEATQTGGDTVINFNAEAIFFILFIVLIIVGMVTIRNYPGIAVVAGFVGVIYGFTWVIAGESALGLIVCCVAAIVGGAGVVRAIK